MSEHRLSILHLSDLHARSIKVDDLPSEVRERRRGQVRREAAGRARVLGEAWKENLRTLYPNGERPDLVCFTGDVADWGLEAEYASATEFINDLESVGIDRSLVYVVPGNHDVQRHVSEAEWDHLRQLLHMEPRATSEWLAGGDPPRAVEAGMADSVMRRTAAFWQWVEQGLGRPELLPVRHAHGRLGYHHVPALPRLPFEVHVIGLDSAWLAGDDHDQGKLWLTEHQRDMLLHDEHGQPWTGFRLALVHHPLEELAQPDIQPTRRGLAAAADVLLHGHQHDAAGICLVDLDGRALRVLAAGCLYEGHAGSAGKNGCQRVDVVLDEAGRPLRAEIHFRAWSVRGHWYSDSSLYRGLTDGRMVWDAWDGGQRAARSQDPADAAAVLDDDDLIIPGLSEDATRVLRYACELILRDDLVVTLVDGGEGLLLEAIPPLSREACRDAIDLLVEYGYVGATPAFGAGWKWLSFMVTADGFREYASKFVPDFDARETALIKRVLEISGTDQVVISSSSVAADLRERHAFVCLVLEDLIERGLLRGDRMNSGEWCVYAPSARLKLEYGA